MVHSGRVVIGMDPHKRSVTIEVMTGEETILGGGRFATDAEGFTAMREYVRAWPQRVWAIEGCIGIGRHVAPQQVRGGMGQLLVQEAGRLDTGSSGHRMLFSRVDSEGLSKIHAVTAYTSTTTPRSRPGSHTTLRDATAAAGRPAIWSPWTPLT